MENDNRSILDRIDPRNYSFTAKILLLVVAILILVIAYYSTAGLLHFRKTLISNAVNDLEEICYVKSAEVNMELKNLENKLLDFARMNLIRHSAEGFTKAFHSLDMEKGHLLRGDIEKKTRDELAAYYKNEVVAHSPISRVASLNYIPNDNLSVLAQHLYLVSNPNQYSEKEELVQDESNTEYSSVHYSYHSALLSALKDIGASDMMLIDPQTGYVVYSVQKNIDFGVNVFKGIHKEGALAESVKGAMAYQNISLYVGEYSNYLPASDAPVVFVSIPVYNNSYLITVLVVQYTSELFDNLLFEDYMLSGANTVKYSVIGNDLKLRNNPREYILDKESYVRRLLKQANKRQAELIVGHNKAGSMALFLEYPFSMKETLETGISKRQSDYEGDEVAVSVNKIVFANRSYSLITQIERSAVSGVFYNSLIRYVGGIFLFIIFLVGIVWIIARKFSMRLIKLSEAIQMLYKGEKAQVLKSGARDELGIAVKAYNSMRKRLLNAEEFAIEMSDGNYGYKFDILSEKDSLGKSLNVLNNKLKQAKEEQDTRTREDEIRNWINNGVAKFNDLLRANNNNIKELAYSVIENLVTYTEASIGGVYMVEGESEEEKTIDLLAAYAYDRRKFEKQSYKTNEGLLGACFTEKKSIFLKKIPEDYIEITSGLGYQIPTCLYIVPLIVDSNVLGIMELASFEELSQYKIELIDKLADSIAGTFIGVRLNMRTVSLLEESRHRAEEITQQEEEMRQNLEEMQATQEELARLRQDDEKKTAEMQLRVDNTRATLKTLINEIPNGVTLKDQNGVIHLVNAEAASYYGSTVDRITGKTDHELLPTKRYKVEHQKDLDALEKGKVEYIDQVKIDGVAREYKIVKKSFLMPELNQNGVLTLYQEVIP